MPVGAFRRSAGALALLGFLSGCGSTSAPAPATVEPASLRVEALRGAGVVYVSQMNGAGTSVVFAFDSHNDRNRGPKCAITGQHDAVDIGTDASGNVYVPDGLTGTVKIFAPACGRLVASFHDQFGSPQGAMPHGSTIYVPGTNGVAVCSLSGCSSELTDASIRQVTSATVDSSGNVWAAYYDQRIGVALIVWRNGDMPGQVVSGYINTLSPGDIEFDSHENLIAVESPFATVSTYSCDASAAACTQTGAFPLRNASNHGALNAADTNFQVADYRLDSVDVYAYPGFSYKYSFDRGLKHGFSPMGVTQVP